MGHGHGHDHGHGDSSRKALWYAFLINAAFLVIEIIGGWISGSLALLADAGHMLSDVAALAVVLWVGYIAKKRATANHSYGFGRVEVLSGFLNGLVLWAISIGIAVEAWRRLQAPQEIDVAIMLPVAVAGLLANAGSAWVLYAHRSHDLNMRAAFLHLMADAAGSVGAILAGFAILLKGWTWVDPAASVLIAVLIVVSSWSLIRESVHILLEGTPPDLNLEEIRQALVEIDGVRSCHDLHVWNVSSREPMLSAHLQREHGCTTAPILDAAKQLLLEKYHIRHSTLQIEDERCEELHG
ncbi:cation diffusion facilitator family transporter [bacterium]|nr:cation diffusion facilitator family transporter [bacterium]